MAKNVYAKKHIKHCLRRIQTFKYSPQNSKCADPYTRHSSRLDSQPIRRVLARREGFLICTTENQNNRQALVFAEKSCVVSFFSVLINFR